eukprot:scaffold290931_cov20-Tisochrysis_lutea.AAC.2
MLQEQAKYKQVSRNSTIAPGFLSVASHEPSAPVHSTTCSTKSKCCLGQTERHSTALDFLCCAPVQHRHGQHDLDSREGKLVCTLAPARHTAMAHTHTHTTHTRSHARTHAYAHIHTHTHTPAPNPCLRQHSRN